MIKKENYLQIHTKINNERKMYQINLNVKNIEELIIQLKHIFEENRKYEKIEYYLINENEIKNW